MVYREDCESRNFVKSVSVKDFMKSLKKVPSFYTMLLYRFGEIPKLTIYCNIVTRKILWTSTKKRGNGRLGKLSTETLDS